MIKKSIVVFLVSIAVISVLFSIVSYAEERNITLKVNGRAVSQDVMIIDGTPYVSLDSLKKGLGIEADYNKESGVVNLEDGVLSDAEIIGKVSPSVVGIIGKLKVSSQGYSPGSDNIVIGTGVIYKSTGYIITNAHVVKDMEKIVVVLSNGKAYTARLKAIDEPFDLAMIKIDKGGLTPAVFGNIDEVAVGDKAIAIGTPLSFSFRNSATKGIISGINRSADGEYRFIQTDAAINSGNSGGPLVNSKGEVIGINSIKYVGFGVEGLSFSIPIDTVQYAIDHFEKYGRIRRPYLGASFSEGVAASYGLPVNEGLTITEIEKGSPAERARLKIDDVLIAIDGKEIATKLDYNEILKQYLPEDTVNLTIRRNETILNIKVKFSEKV